MSLTNKILRLLDVLPKIPQIGRRRLYNAKEVGLPDSSREVQAFAALRDADEKNQEAGTRLFRTALDEADHTDMVKGQIDRSLERLGRANDGDKVLATAEAALELVARRRLRR